MSPQPGAIVRYLLDPLCRQQIAARHPRVHVAWRLHSHQRSITSFPHARLFRRNTFLRLLPKP